MVRRGVAPSGQEVALDTEESAIHALPDDLQRQVLVALESQDGPQAPDIGRAILAVSARGSDRSQQPTILEIANFGDAQIGELGPNLVHDLPDASESLRTEKLSGPYRLRRGLGHVFLHGSFTLLPRSRAPESQLELAYLQFVALHKSVPLDPLAVDVGAVQTVEIFDQEPALITNHPRMMPGHGDVVEEHVAVGTAADGKNVSVESDDLPFPAAAGADDEHRALPEDLGPQEIVFELLPCPPVHR